MEERGGDRAFIAGFPEETALKGLSREDTSLSLCSSVQAAVSTPHSNSNEPTRQDSFHVAVGLSQDSNPKPSPAPTLNTPEPLPSTNTPRKTPQKSAPAEVQESLTPTQRELETQLSPDKGGGAGPVPGSRGSGSKSPGSKHTTPSKRSPGQSSHRCRPRCVLQKRKRKAPQPSQKHPMYSDGSYWKNLGLTDDCYSYSCVSIPKLSYCKL